MVAQDPDITLFELRDALAAVTGDDGAGETGAAAPGEAQLASIRSDLGEAAFARFVAQLIEEGDALLPRLARPGRTQEALNELAAECHKFAGSAAMFGALDMRDVLVEFETAAKAGETEELATLAHRAKGVWSRTRKRLTRPA